MNTSSSPKCPIMPCSSFRRSEASTLKPVDGSVDGSGNHVLNLWAKARALKRACSSSGEKDA